MKKLFLNKYLKIALSILLIVLIGYFGYTHFKKKSVLLNVIHKDAESVIKIGVHDITKTLVLDALTSPSYYWKNSKSLKKDKKKDSIKDDDFGIDLRPYSMVFYSIKNINNTLFTTLIIEDIEAFERNIKKYSIKKSSNIDYNKKGYKQLVLEKSKLILAWNSEKLAIALTTNASIEKLKVVFEDVLIEEKLITDRNHDIIKKLSELSDHIVYVSKEDLITLNFKDGETLIDGIISTEQLDTYPTRNIVYDTIPDSSLQLYFDANFENKENKKVIVNRLNGFPFFSKNNLDISELAERTNGFINLAVSGTTLQKDTIVSYEYDDNFEKIAVKTLQEKQVPKISIDIGTTDIDSLKTYLKNKGAIKEEILTSIPYYILYAKDNGDKMSFSTSENYTSTEEIHSSSFFKLNVNFNRLQEDISIPRANDVLALLQTLQIKANQISGSNHIKIKGSLKGDKADINIISQVFFALKKQEAKSQLVE